MANRNKQRGYVLEKEVQDYWQALGVDCKRVLGSGAFKKYSASLKGDLNLNGLLVECKRRRNGEGFKQIYSWFEQDEADILVLRADRQPRLYVIPESLMVRFASDMGWLSVSQETDENSKEQGEKNA